MTRFESAWRPLSRHKGQFDADSFRFQTGKEWKDLPGSLEINPHRSGRRARVRLYVDQDGDGLFSRDELIFNGRTGRQESKVIDALMDEPGGILLKRQQSSVACALAGHGARCTFSVRSLLTLQTDSGTDVELNPKGASSRETITFPTGPQIGDLELNDKPINPAIDLPNATDLAL